MPAFSELILLALSLGTLNSWNNDTSEHAAYSEASAGIDTFEQSTPESRSLYDLMAHFPTDQDISCTEPDARMSYPGKCSQYITCRNYQAHIRSCPPGMSFDESYGHCRLAYEVDCEDMHPASICDPNEEYLDCNCERTCDNFHEIDYCGEECVSGCFCRMGYVRDNTGNCIRPEACENNVFHVLKSKY